MKTKFLARVALVLVLAQTVLILVSWIINAMAPQAAVRSLLSSEGIRWFFGRFVSNLASPLLVWMLLISVAYGAWRTSGLPEALRAMASPGKLYFRQRFALRLALVILLFSVVVILLLTMPSHAILASASGGLFPSSFTRSLVPIVAFIVCAVSLVYASASGKCHSIEDAFRSLYVGISYTLPLWPIYILGVQLYYSFLFVFFR